MLLYSLVARSRDGAILVEAKTSGVEGNYPQVTSQLLDELVKNPSLVPIGVRKTFTTNIITNSSKSNFNGGDIEMNNYWGGRRTVDVDYGDVLGTEYEDRRGSEYLFHVVQGESSYFLCLSDDADGIQHRINFGFLMSVQKEFTQKYTPNKIEKANAYGFEKGFSQILSQMMHHTNTTRYSTGVDPNTAKLTSEIESLKRIMGNNIELLMNRGDELDKIVERSDDLLIESKVFSKRGKRLKKVMKRKAMLYKMVIVVFFLVTIYFMIAKICGFDLTCASSDSS